MARSYSRHTAERAARSRRAVARSQVIVGWISRNMSGSASRSQQRVAARRSVGSRRTAGEGVCPHPRGASVATRAAAPQHRTTPRPLRDHVGSAHSAVRRRTGTTDETPASETPSTRPSRTAVLSTPDVHTSRFCRRDRSSRPRSHGARTTRPRTDRNTHRSCDNTRDARASEGRLPWRPWLLPLGK
jgi:hypothetical protein